MARLLSSSDPAAPDADPFALWRQSLSGVFEIARSCDDPAPFVEELQWRSARRCVLARIVAGAVRLFPALDENERLDHAAMILLERGEAFWRVGAERRPFERGDLLLVDWTQHFELRPASEANAEMIFLWTPRAHFREAMSQANLLHGMSLSGRSGAASVLAATLRALFEQAGSLKPPELDALAGGFVEMAGRSLDLALQGADRRLTSEPLATFVSLRNFIDANIASTKLDADMIARAFGLSRATLYRLFAPVGGVASYIRKARLDRAYREIASPRLANKRIGQIAMQAGFSNVSAFNRLFAETYGVSPSEARTRSLAGEDGDLLWTSGGARSELRRRLELIRA